ncbi:hypothetical protein [Paenibacillus polymyxa]|uniref:hypothetical protein n=1 Tax=Paenibacillus polymyxa TaxID=1406 RepID=UPI0025B6B790|nr:hypothetical protein [Paenibacillus polymyxa]MDN4106404.1 hypothetical protein [Paenibacillus polymyxa]
MIESYLRKETDTREPYQKIRLDADDRIDFEFSVTYSVLVSVNTIGNSFRYKGVVCKPYSRKGKCRWRVRLVACGGEYDSYDSLTLQVLNQTAMSLKHARKLIANSIVEFEATPRYKVEIWSKILDSDRRVPILKKVDGEFIWVATTWEEASAAIQGKRTWKPIGSLYELPFGSGEFYYREMKWEQQYRLYKDGTRDWSSRRKIKETYYVSIKVSERDYPELRSIKDKEMIEKINEAVGDINEK